MGDELINNQIVSLLFIFSVSLLLLPLFCLGLGVAWTLEGDQLVNSMPRTFKTLKLRPPSKQLSSFLFTFYILLLFDCFLMICSIF